MSDTPDELEQIYNEIAALEAKAKAIAAKKKLPQIAALLEEGLNLHQIADKLEPLGAKPVAAKTTGAKRGPRGTGKTAEVLAAIQAGHGSRGLLMKHFNIDKSDTAGAQSISNALAALKKQGSIVPSANDARFYMDAKAD